MPTTGSEDAAAVGEKLVDAFRDPFEVAGRRVFCSASVGIALFPDHGTAYSSLLQRSNRALDGQGPGPGYLAPVRAEHEHGHGRPDGPGDGPAQRLRGRRVPGLLPTAGRPLLRGSRRGGGAGALAAPHPGSAGTRPVHPPGGRSRPGPPHRPVGAPCRLRPGPGLAGRRPPPAQDLREPVRGRTRPPRPGDQHPPGHRRLRHPRRPARARGDRDHRPARGRRDPTRAPATPGPRGRGCHRRHRPLDPGTPRQLPVRRPEDRQVLHRPDRLREVRRSPRARHHRDGAQPQPRRRRRGRRACRAALVPARPRLRPGAGLPAGTPGPRPQLERVMGRIQGS